MAASEPLGARKRLVFAAVTLLAPPALLLVTIEAACRLLVPRTRPSFGPAAASPSSSPSPTGPEAKPAGTNRIVGLGDSVM
jgi:hypothetical protein